MNSGQEYNLTSGGVGGWGGGGWGGFGGGGWGGIAPIGLFGIFGGRRGFGGGGDDCCDGGNRRDVWDVGMLNKLATIEAAIPQSTNATKDAIQGQTLFQSQAFSNLLLAGQQATATTKDSIQGAYALLTNQNTALATQMAEGFCSVKQAIDAEGDSIKALITANRISQLETELLQERQGRHSRETEINVTQQVNQAQAQQQQQQQLQGLIRGYDHLCGLFGQFQAAAIANKNVAFGTGNTITPTNTNNANQVG